MKNKFKKGDRVLIRGKGFFNEDFIGKCGVISIMGADLCGVDIDSYSSVPFFFESIELLPPSKITIRRKEVDNG